MAISWTLFGASSRIEKQLEETYVPVVQNMMGVSTRETKKIVRGLLKKAKAASVRDGTANLPANAGELLTTCMTKS